jgi:tripartite ATP-independent transporter DctM subunit
MTVALVLIMLAITLAMGMPVGFALTSSGCVGLYALGGSTVLVGILKTSPVSVVSAYELITIPMFLLMAELVLLSGIVDGLFRAAAAWVGHVKGGLGMATAVAGAGFGAICGTSTGSAATLSATSLPAMLKQGYEPKIAAGVVAISGTLAMLIPPSVALVIFGLLAEVNIAKLLMGGIVPAIIVTATIMGTVWFLAWKNPERAPVSPRVPFKERVMRLREVGPVLALFALVTGAIYSGIATPTEAAGLGAFGAFCLVVSRGKLTFGGLKTALLRAATATCMIAMMIVGAHIFGYFFVLSHVTQELVSWVGSLPINRWLIIAVILLGYIVLGTFLDQMAILVLTVPIVLPLVVALGFDPLWFGVIKIVTAEVGMITPPVGLNCFVVARYSDRPVQEVFQGSMPHFVAHIFVIALLTAFPAIVLWLPSLMR